MKVSGGGGDHSPGFGGADEVAALRPPSVHLLGFRKVQRVNQLLLLCRRPPLTSGSMVID